MGKPLIDMTGLTIGDLYYVVGKHEENYVSGEAQWNVKCLQTGEMRVMVGSDLRDLQATHHHKTHPDQSTERRRQRELQLLLRDLRKIDLLEKLVREKQAEKAKNSSSV